MLTKILIAVAVIVVVLVIVVALQPSGVPRRPEHHDFRSPGSSVCASERFS